MKIFIDNGHGRNTAGKRSPDGQFLEYYYNRIVARRVTAKLQALGLDAELLVPEVDDVSLAERCRRVNAWCRFHGKENAICVSIHFNAYGNGSAWTSPSGWSIYTSSLPGFASSFRSESEAQCSSSSAAAPFSLRSPDLWLPQTKASEQMLHPMSAAGSLRSKTEIRFAPSHNEIYCQRTSRRGCPALQAWTCKRSPSPCSTS